ncbi:hypothetical protein FTX61_01280 [Nitriliruptoraceae bacterium ZYF776]|nr:hypothetical protein [Profundirhabdus halotolerans]
MAPRRLRRRRGVCAAGASWSWLVSGRVPLVGAEVPGGDPRCDAGRCGAAAGGGWTGRVLSGPEERPADGRGALPAVELHACGPSRDSTSRPEATQAP